MVGSSGVLGTTHFLKQQIILNKAFLQPFLLYFMIFQIEVLIFVKIWRKALLTYILKPIFHMNLGSNPKMRFWVCTYLFNPLLGRYYLSALQFKMCNCVGSQLYKSVLIGQELKENSRHKDRYDAFWRPKFVFIFFQLVSKWYTKKFYCLFWKVWIMLLRYLV